MSETTFRAWVVALLLSIALILVLTWQSPAGKLTDDCVGNGRVWRQGGRVVAVTDC